MSINASIRESTRGGRFLALLVLVTLAVHPIAFVLGTDTSLSVYVTFFSFLFLLGYSISNGKWIVERREVLLICVASVGCIVGAVAGAQVYGDSGLGSAVGYLLALAAVLPFASSLNKADVIILLYTILLFGLAAALYAFLFQATQWANVLCGNQAGSNSWHYYSFFGQRNRFAACLYLSIICSSAMFALTRRKLFVLVAAFLLLQIVITNSRAALGASLLFLFVCVLLGSRNRTLTGIFIACSVILAACLFPENLVDKLGSFLTHYGGFDSASARTDMWEYGINELTDSGFWLFGLGTGTQHVALSPRFGVSSFHNMYIELLFEGGIVKAGSYLVLVLGSVMYAKNNKAFVEDRLFSLLYLPMIISWLAFSIFEAGATPFSTTFYSFVMSVLLFILPRCYRTDVMMREELVGNCGSSTGGGMGNRNTECVVLGAASE